MTNKLIVDLPTEVGYSVDDFGNLPSARHQESKKLKKDKQTQSTRGQFSAGYFFGKACDRGNKRRSSAQPQESELDDSRPESQFHCSPMLSQSVSSRQKRRILKSRKSPQFLRSGDEFINLCNT